MAHSRARHLQEVLKKCLGFSPLVGVLGHRQVGKTTLLSQMAGGYHTLDIKVENDQARANPAAYLKDRAGKWVVLDECQSAPELFPELKEWVRKNPRPGQFILSGSVRFTSREAIRESLTGRIINLELLPMTVRELNEKPLSDFCWRALSYSHLESLLSETSSGSSGFKTKAIEKSHRDMLKYFETGGLPGICFIRDEKLRRLKLEEQLNTILDRDLRQVRRVAVSLRDLKHLLLSLARQQGQVLNYTQIKLETGLSAPTIKKIIAAMEALFLFRIHTVEGGASRETLYFEDQGEWRWILNERPSPLQALTHFAYTQIRAQFAYRLGDGVETFQYRTRGGALVPLAFKSKSGVLGVLPVHQADAAMDALGSVNSFLKSYSQSKVLIVHPELSKPRLLQPRVMVVPIGCVI